jgi:peptide chain release factor 1
MEYNDRLYDTLVKMVAKYDSLNNELEDSAIPISRVSEINKQLKRIGIIKEKFLEYKKTIEDIKSDEKVLEKDKDKDLLEMAQLELNELKTKYSQIEAELKILLLPIDPYNDKNIIVEMRPAAGGDEASIFTADLFDTYKNYCENQG